MQAYATDFHHPGGILLEIGLPGHSSVMGFSANLTRYREVAGLTKSQLAKAVDSTYKVIHGYESGVIPRELSRVEELADVLGVSVDDLLGREPPEPPYPAWRQFLASKQGKEAPPTVLRQLRALRWDHRTPTVTDYQDLLRITAGRGRR